MSRLKKTLQQVKAASPWDWLLQESERDQRERRAYVDACALDEIGEHTEADAALRVAGIREAVIQNRREHINWRLSQGMPVIGA